MTSPGAVQISSMAIPDLSPLVSRYVYVISGSLNVLLLGGQILGWSGIQVRVHGNCVLMPRISTFLPGAASVFISIVYDK